MSLKSKKQTPNFKTFYFTNPNSQNQTYINFLSSSQFSGHWAVLIGFGELTAYS